MIKKKSNNNKLIGIEYIEWPLLLIFPKEHLLPLG